MLIFVLSTVGFEFSDVVGVYTTLEKAQRGLLDINGSELHIESYEVDGSTRSSTSHWWSHGYSDTWEPY